MELGHETLEKWLNNKKNKKNFEVIKFWMRDLIEGVRHIHSYGMIHGDLKPSNILMFHELLQTTLKISDFGLVSIMAYDEQGDLAPHSGGKGTEMYMAPEQKKGGKEYTEKVDIFSLGLIFIELLYPLNKNEKEGIFNARRKGNIPKILQEDKNDTVGALILDRYVDLLYYRKEPYGKRNRCLK